MKTIIFNQKQYDVPEKWEDVKVGMLVKSAELSELLGDAPLIAIMSAYTGIPLQQLKSDKSKEAHEVMDTMSFIAEPYEAKPETSFEFNGSTYSCPETLTSQPFEDWVSVQTVLHNNREHQEQSLPKLIAIMCKKDSESIDDFDLDDRAKEFLELPMTCAKDIECFFLHSLRAYKSVTLLSSTQNEVETIVLHKVDELQNTMKTRKAQSGLSFGTRLLIGYLQIYLWWVRKVLVKSFSSIPSKPRKKTFKQTLKKLLNKKRGKENDGNSNS